MRERHVVVLGGGITGLAAAFRLRKLARDGDVPLRISVFEADNRFGGKISTYQTEKYTLELGPDSIFTPKLRGISLLDELNLTEQTVPVNPSKTFVMRHSQLHPLPPGVSSGIPTDFRAMATTKLLSMPGKIRALKDYLVPGEPLAGDVAIGKFLRDRLGDEVVDVLAAPLLAGIHAADIDKLSLDATMPMLRQMYAESRSLMRGMMAAQAKRASAGTGAGSGSAGSGSTAPGGAGPSANPDASAKKSSVFVSFQGGLQSLIDRLVESLSQDAQLVTDAKALSVRTKDEGGYDVIVSVKGGQPSHVSADAVVVTLPAFQAADVLSDLPIDDSLLRQVRYVSTGTVLLGYDQEDVASYPQSGAQSGAQSGQGGAEGTMGSGSKIPGSGFLVPRGETVSMTACTVVSSKWPHAVRGNEKVFRCYVGRDGQEEILEADDEWILQRVTADLAKLDDSLNKPTLRFITRWPSAMPQYDVGHLDRLNKLDQQIQQCPGVSLAGAAYRGMGIPDCIRSADTAAAKTMEFLANQSV